MNPVRISLTTLFAILILLLASCSQSANTPADSAIGAQAGKNITINNTASCEAAGGQMDLDERECFLPDDFVLAAGDTLNLGGSAELGSVIFPDKFINYGTILSAISIFPNSTLTNLGTISLTGGGDRLYHDTFINSGTLNLTNARIIAFVNTTITNTASGIINLNSGGTIQNYVTFINDGTINVYCGGSFFNAGSYTGKPTLDGCAPSVTVNQASTQADPTSASTIHFTAVFSEAVVGFGIGDVFLSGTAGATTAVVSEIAPNNGTTYDIAVSGMNKDGTVIASILVARAKDAAGNDNTASTSTDNTVTYIVPDTTAPAASPTQSPAANSNGWNNSDVTVTWNWSDAGSGIDSANCTTSSTSSGEGSIKLSATCKDKAGNEGSAEYTVKVDKTAPKCTVTVNPVSLWAPNHKLTNVSTSVSVLDTNADGFTLKSVTSSEADSGLGTDDVPNDIQGWTLNTADTSGQLRSERYSKAGRTYILTYQAKDKAGNTGTCTASVSVPKSQK